MIPILSVISGFNIPFDLYQKFCKRFKRNRFGVVPMLRCLLSIKLYKTGERGVARKLRYDKGLVKACGFKKRVPTQSWISRFRERVSDLLDEVFYDLVNKLKELKIFKGKDWSIDSTHIDAYSNKHKRKKSDRDASWGYKNAQKKWFFGYKAHIVCDSEQELPIGYTVTTGKTHDSLPAKDLLDSTHQKTKFIPEIIRGDGAYNSTEIRENIRHYGAKDDIPHKGHARDKKEVNKRASIEHINSRTKEGYGLNDLKLRGLTKVLTHVGLSLITQLQTAYTLVKNGHPEQVRKIALW